MGLETPLNAAQLRKAIAESSGIITSTWQPNNPQRPLPYHLQLMGDDIAKWLNPTQGWHLAQVNIGAITPKRMAESSTDFEGTQSLKANTTEPDKLVTHFHYDAKKLPISRGIFGQESVNFSRVFAADLENRLTNISQSSAEVIVDHVGPVKILPYAIDDLSSPYYLPSQTGYLAQVNLTERYDGPIYHDKKGRRFPGSLSVMILMRDLDDYFGQEIAHLQSRQSQLSQTLFA